MDLKAVWGVKIADRTSFIFDSFYGIFGGFGTVNRLETPMSRWFDRVRRAHLAFGSFLMASVLAAPFTAIAALLGALNIGVIVALVVMFVASWLLFLIEGTWRNFGNSELAIQLDGRSDPIS